MSEGVRERLESVAYRGPIDRKLVKFVEAMQHAVGLIINMTHC